MITAQHFGFGRQIIATGLGFIALLCVAQVYLACGFVVWHGVPDVDEGACLVFTVILFSATPAIISTLAALALVGPERCKLAWVSLTLYLPFLFAALFIAFCEPSH